MSESEQVPALPEPEMVAPYGEGSWDEFRDAGLLWWINRNLHLFGWAIVVDVEADINGTQRVVRAYPSRCKFRGFCEDSEERGFKKLTKHIEQEMPRILKDADSG